MQVYKSFFKIAKKNCKSSIIYLIIYITMILAFTFSGNSNLESSFKTSSLNVIIQDEDHSAASRALTDYLSSIHTVSTEQLTNDALADRLYYRYVDYCLVIPKGFENELLAGNTEDICSTIFIPGTRVGTFVTEQVKQYIGNLRLNLAGGYDLDQAIDHTNQQIAALPQVNLYNDETSTGSSSNKFFAYYQYLPYILVLLLFVGMAPILVIHNERDRKSRTMISCLSSSSRTLQLAAGCATYAFIVWAIFQLIPMFLFTDSAFTQNASLARANSFVFMIFVTALALLISTFAPNGNAVNMLANTVGLGMSFLCGVFVPQSMLGSNVLAVGKFLPAYWYIAVNNMLSGESTQLFDMKYYLQSLGIQFTFAIAVFAIMLSLSKYRKKAR